MEGAERATRARAGRPSSRSDFGWRGGSVVYRGTHGRNVGTVRHQWPNGSSCCREEVRRLNVVEGEFSRLMFHSMGFRIIENAFVLRRTCGLGRVFLLRAYLHRRYVKMTRPLYKAKPGPLHPDFVFLISLPRRVLRPAPVAPTA